MLINKLSLTNIRAFTQAEFEFKPGMNLLVGINGVGKTTVLDALRICLSFIIPDVTSSKNRKENFDVSDIKIGARTLQLTCDFTVNEAPFNLLIVKQRETAIPNEEGNPRAQVTETPDKEFISPPIKKTFPNITKENRQPIAVFFSTRRALITEAAPSKSSIAGGQAAAFADALSGSREFNLRIFASWYKVQKELGKEKPSALKTIEILEQAVTQFLPEFHNLNIVEEDDKIVFTIQKGDITLPLNQFSDGERGMLALVLDIARRLSQANVGLENPLTDGKGIILIDELDLHLHPKWQRSIVENLTRVFQNCQFIATTHSPQILPSLLPDRIQIINHGEVNFPDRSFGLDSNWVLKFLMESDDRPEISSETIEKIEELINSGEFDEAKALISKNKKLGYDLPEWSVFEARIARLEIIGDNDEENN